jgi:hypothetical protein
VILRDKPFCSFVGDYKRFGGTCSFHLPTLMLEAAGSNEKSEIMKIHGIIIQKTTISILTAVETSYLIHDA